VRFQASAVKQMRTALFWNLGCLTFKDGTEKLSQNIVTNYYYSCIITQKSSALSLVLIGSRNVGIYDGPSVAAVEEARSVYITLMRKPFWQ